MLGVGVEALEFGLEVGMLMGEQSITESVSEHRPAALGLSLGCLVL
jgi:hypothetical protein